MLDAAASAAEIFGSGEIRLTPWRALILPFVHAKDADAIRTYLAAHGFIVDREDPRLAITACGGASTCERGSTDTRADALTLMFAARRLCKIGAVLHVSGCAKGCAQPAATPLNLVADEGLYEFLMDENALDAGTGNAKGLTLAAARESLETSALRKERQSELESQ
jgi:precorrin-3B synthase